MVTNATTCWAIFNSASESDNDEIYRAQFCLLLLQMHKEDVATNTCAVDISPGATLIVQLGTKNNNLRLAVSNNWKPFAAGCLGAAKWIESTHTMLQPQHFSSGTRAAPRSTQMPMYKGFGGHQDLRFFANVDLLRIRSADATAAIFSELQTSTTRKNQAFGSHAVISCPAPTFDDARPWRHR